MSSTSKKSDYSLWYTLLPAGLLSAITALVYWPSLHYDFQFDDIANIQKHFNIRHYSFSGLFFTGSRWISYWLNSFHYKIGKFDPFSYRLGNVIIHSLNGMLIFLVTLTALSHLKKRSFFSENAFGIALITSLLFLVHPVQTQTVSYVIQGQLEGLAALFIMSMILTYLHRAYTTNQTLQWLLTGLFFVLAAFSCGTKEIAIISPVLILLIDWFFVAQGNMRSLISRWWMFALLTLNVVGWYLYFLKPSFFTNILGLNMTVKNNIGNIITQDPKAVITAWPFFISQFKVILHYLWMFIWPFNISVEYDWVLCKGFFAFDCIVPLMILLTIGGLIIRKLLRNPTSISCFGALWFFVCIAPRSSIIPSPELLVDYKTYTASYGWLLLLATAIVALATFALPYIRSIALLSREQHALTAFALLLALPLGYSTYQRNLVWSSGKNFWGNIIANAPGKARAYNNYGVELSQQFKQYKESIPYFRKAIEMDPYYPDPCNNLAVACSHLGDTDTAIEALRRGLKINPYYPEGYNNLASFLLQQKKLDQAEKALMHAIKMRPHYGKAYFNLGRIYLERNEKEKAWEHFRTACMNADLDTELGFNTFAKISLSLKKYDDAIFAYNRVIEANPQNKDAYFNLANSYFFVQEYAKASQYFNKAIEMDPNDTRAWYNLGETHFKAGNYNDAIAAFERIKHYSQQLPQMNLRLASCYEKMFNHKKAQEVLEELVNMKRTAHIPENIRTLARDYLAQITETNRKIDSITAAAAAAA